MTAATADGTEVRSANRPRYRPHLDGLRAVAVALVIAFHAGFGWARGGFIGVDVFFVLSGFLITRILLDDLTTRDRVRGRQFYARRARRILPAAIATLVITAVSYAIVATPEERLTALGGFRSAFLYVSNWYFIHQSTSYFAANVTTNPVLHFWSLAVEEQFYLVWPLVLGGLWVMTRRAGRARWWVLRVVIIGAGLVSAGAAVHIGATNVDRAYYGTDTRAYQLLAGAALALVPLTRAGRALAGRAGRWVATGAFVGLVVVASSVLEVSPITRGLLATALATMLIVVLENARGAFVKGVLSSAPFVYLGRISYGIYLWHWPVMVLALHGRSLSSTRLFFLSAALATALAALGFHVLEHPVRVWGSLDRYRTPVIAIGLSASVLGGAFLMPSILETGNSSIAAAHTGGPRGSGPRLLDWRVARNDIPPLPDCLGRPVEQCTIVRGNGLHVLLVGDSNARMWIPAFRQIAKAQSWTLSVAAFPDCPWQQALEYALGPKVLASCRAHKADWYQRVIPTLDPDVIVLVHQAYDDPALPPPMDGPDGTKLKSVGAARERALVDASAASLRELRRPGRRLVIVEPIPLAPAFRNPLSCLSEGGDWSRCVYQANPVATPLERYYRDADRERADVVSLDLDDLACPRLPACDPVIGDVIVKRDTGHLTATFARTLAGAVERRLARAGVLTR